MPASRYLSSSEEALWASALRVIAEQHNRTTRSTLDANVRLEISPLESFSPFVRNRTHRRYCLSLLRRPANLLDGGVFFGWTHRRNLSCDGAGKHLTLEELLVQLERRFLREQRLMLAATRRLHCNQMIGFPPPGFQ